MSPRITVIGAVLLALSAQKSFAIENGGVDNEFSKLPRTNKMLNVSRIASIFESTKPVCFTRFVIDVPVSATVVYGRMTIDAEIERYAEMAGDFDKFIERKIAGGKNNLRIFGRGSKIDKLAEFPLATKSDSIKHVIGVTGFQRYSLDSFVMLGDDIYILSEKGVMEGEIYKFIRDNEVTASMLRKRRVDEMPDEEGVCIDGAFTPQNADYENIQLGIRLAEFPDAHLSISLLKNLDYVESQEEFLERHAAVLEKARESGRGEWVDRLRLLRKTSRNLNGWAGDEILIQFPVWKEAKQGHQFAFWSTGKPNDPIHPHVDIKLDTGVKGNMARGVPASLTDEEAVALWDKLLNSIRVRPVNADKQKSSRVPSAEVPLYRVGTRQSTDSTCPVSGWWQSFDSDAAEPMRWIEKGAVMPPIHFRQEETWRDKLFDTRRVALGSGTWELMRHDERSDPPNS